MARRGENANDHEVKAADFLIVDFERSGRPVSREAVQAIREALELAGIKFVDENGGGPGVRLRRRQGSKKPKQAKG
ncbi:MAG: hypothetical protein WA214_04365 [Pseudolabrys sp.]